MYSFEHGLRAQPAVVEALHATGDHDYPIRVRCTDADHLHRRVRALKADLGAVRTVTRLGLDQTMPAGREKPTTRRHR